ncbi:hypothetical protein D3C81_982030 [compost metagenome]
MLVGLVELVADKRRHQRLDAAGAKSDQPQAGEEAHAAVLEHRQERVAQAVDQAEGQDGVVLAEEAVGDPAAQQREEVHADHEGVHQVLGRQRALTRIQDVLQQCGGDQELHQDVAHPVETEPLTALVADDVGNLPGHLAGRDGTCCYVIGRHQEAIS